MEMTKWAKTHLHTPNGPKLVQETIYIAPNGPKLIQELIYPKLIQQPIYTAPNGLDRS
jgi:hypothetical protein